MRREFGEGMDVTVRHLASTEGGVVERVEDDGRTVLVVTHSGAILEFHLMASAHFWTSDRSARLTTS